MIDYIWFIFIANLPIFYLLMKAYFGNIYEFSRCISLYTTKNDFFFGDFNSKMDSTMASFKVAFYLITCIGLLAGEVYFLDKIFFK